VVRAIAQECLNTARDSCFGDASVIEDDLLATLYQVAGDGCADDTGAANDQDSHDVSPLAASDKDVSMSSWRCVRTMWAGSPAAGQPHFDRMKLPPTRGQRILTSGDIRPDGCWIAD
jgi:hypothetical protein